MAWVAGLTGGLASGKSTVARLFAELGAVVVDTDDISHMLTTRDGAALPALKAAFPPAFFTNDGVLNRPHMRAAIFADAQSRKKLQDILHPLIFKEVGRRLAQLPRSAVVILVVPLLLETGNLLPLCQRVLVVDCPEELQIARARRRDGVDETQITAILTAQASRAERLAMADDVIENLGEAEALRPQVAQLYQSYRQMASGVDR